MDIEIVSPTKQKSWGIIPRDGPPGHFHTGYVPPSLEDRMEVGKNVIITGDFRVVGTSRGRSAAKVRGFFRGHENEPYLLGLQATFEVVEAIQFGHLRSTEDGFIRGRWTFAKQGCDILLKVAA